MKLSPGLHNQLRPKTRSNPPGLCLQRGAHQVCECKRTIPALRLFGALIRTPSACQNLRIAAAKSTTDYLSSIKSLLSVLFVLIGYDRPNQHGAAKHAARGSQRLQWRIPLGSCQIVCGSSRFRSSRSSQLLQKVPSEALGQVFGSKFRHGRSLPVEAC